MKLERTTILLQKPFMSQVRAAAKERNMSLSAFLTLLIREGLRLIKTETKHKYEFKPVVVHGDKPPLIDIADRDALYHILDRDSPYRK
jgi:hypothetical protein